MKRERLLVILCPDIRWRATLEAILARHESLGLPRPLAFDVFNVPGQTDGGVRTSAPALLRPYRTSHAYAIVVFDHRGCGDDRTPSAIEEELGERLRAEWGDRAEAVVVSPELEAWLVGAHQHFGAVRQLASVKIRQWWKTHGDWPNSDDKPLSPKTAVESVFRHYEAPPSSANYRKIASLASLRPESCHCPSFQRLVFIIQRWFRAPAPVAGSGPAPR